MMQMTLHRQDCAQVLYTPFSNLSIVIVIVIVSIRHRTVHSKFLKPHPLLVVFSKFYSQSEGESAEVLLERTELHKTKQHRSDAPFAY